MNTQLHLFNPENDMALANNTIYYKAPREIIRMAADLSAFPVWFANPDDYVKLDSTYRISTFLSLCNDFGIHPKAHLTVDYLPLSYRPWGWNLSLINKLRNKDIPEHFYPTDLQMNAIRRLSGRQVCMTILSEFSHVDYCCGSCVECFTLDEVQQFLSLNSVAVFKAPWSGSGRGIMKIDSCQMDPNTEGWISRILRTQGSIMAEPFYDKVCDFAVEYYADGKGGISYAGLSMFETDGEGYYKGNILASDEWIAEQLEKYISADCLKSVIKKLILILQKVVGCTYSGYFGIDMMICRLNDKYYLHPCVELNLRMNMGIATRIIYNQYVMKGEVGKFIVEHFFNDGDALDFYNLMKRIHPCNVMRERLITGYLPLTPIDMDTRFHAYLII